MTATHSSERLRSIIFWLVTIGLILAVVIGMRSAGVFKVKKTSGATTPPPNELDKPLIDGPRYASKTTGMKFMHIPKGTFTMGSPESEMDRSVYEKKHEVTLTKDYYLGIHEVTRGQFRKFVDDDGYKTEAEVDGKGGYGYVGNEYMQDPQFNWRDAGFSQTDDHPVVNVSWNDAVKYVEWLSKKDGRTYRLPTEAEWEYACRGGDMPNLTFGIGDGQNLSSAEANFDGNFPYGDAANSENLKGTCCVGNYKPNKFGLYDMHGNEWEWCLDRTRWDDYSSEYVTGSYRGVRGLDPGFPGREQEERRQELPIGVPKRVRRVVPE